MPALKEHQHIPTDARDMHSHIFPGKDTRLPLEIAQSLSSFQNIVATDKIGVGLEKTSSLQPLLDSFEQETLIVEESLEEQTIARTLLLRFGLPYLPGAEEVWLTLSEYLVNAKKATEQTQLQLKQSIDQIRALLITQLTTDQESRLVTLEKEEEKHKQGIATLQKTDANLVEESQLISQNNGAIAQKKNRLVVISAQKRQIKDSIESMRAMVSNLITNFISIHRFDSAQLVMA